MSNIKRKPKNKKPTDINGKPHGEWVSYDSNGLLDYRLNYNHGIPHGLWERYFSDGAIYYRGCWNMETRIAYWRFRDKKCYYLCLI